MSDVEDRLFELRAIKRTLTIGHSEKLDAYLDEVITTPNRRKMWMHVDGVNDTVAISDIVGVSHQAVRDFLKVMKAAGLVEWEPRGIPRRIIDHIPANWLKDSEEE